MENKPLLKTPVLFIIWNRPDTTRRVFEAIQKARPEKLFIGADGPRDGNTRDRDLCEASRAIVTAIGAVDWPCEIHTRFLEKNVGCKEGVSGAINWFFEHVDKGIILEDDCLPVASFFPYASALLEKYRANERIMHISGTNFLTPAEIHKETNAEIGAPSSSAASYRFSRCNHVWGWATWKRAWKKYDISMAHIDELKAMQKVEPLFLEEKYLDVWINLFKHIKKANVDTWDAQWGYSILYNRGITITPNTNLIENIGFGADATHTFKKDPHILTTAELPISSLVHPQTVAVDMRADAVLVRKLYMPSFWKKIISKLQ